MTDKKATGFDKATGGPEGEIPDSDSAEGASPIPRAVFTLDNNIDASRMQIGQLRIAQGMSTEVQDRKAQIGQFLLTNFGPKDEVVLIPLGSANVRVYKPDPKKPALCHAPTGNFGFGNPGGECVDADGNPVCPLAKWGEKQANGKSKPPACADGITIRFYSVTHRSMVDFSFLKADRGRGSFIQQQAVAFGWCNFAVKMTSSTRTNDKGSWPGADIQILEEDSTLVSDEQKMIAQKFFGLFNQIQVSTREEALLQLQAIN